MLWKNNLCEVENLSVEQGTAYCTAKKSCQSEGEAEYLGKIMKRGLHPTPMWVNREGKKTISTTYLKKQPTSTTYLKKKKTTYFHNLIEKTTYFHN